MTDRQGPFGPNQALGEGPAPDGLGPSALQYCRLKAGESAAMDAAVSKLLDQRGGEYFTQLPSGKLLCSLNGYEVLPRVDALQQFLGWALPPLHSSEAAALRYCSGSISITSSTTSCNARHMPGKLLPSMRAACRRLCNQGACPLDNWLTLRSPT